MHAVAAKRNESAIPEGSIDEYNGIQTTEKYESEEEGKKKQ